MRSFEASFTHPHTEPGTLRSQRWLLVAHFNEPTTLERVRELLEPQSGPLVYASREVASASFLRGRRPTDPNPLSYKQTACFAAGEETELRMPPLEHTILQLYRRANPRRLLAAAR